MNNALQEFRAQINNETELLMDEYNTRELAFTKYFLSEFSELLNCGEYEIGHFIKLDAANRVRGEAFGYALSDNDEVLTLFYTLYNTSNEIISLTNTDYKNCLNKLQGFYDLAIRATYIDLDKNNPSYEALKFIYDNNSTFKTVKLCIISNCIINNSRDIKKIKITKPVDWDCWDIRKIFHQLSSEADHIHINVDFNDEYKNYKIPFIKMESKDFEYKCILAMFPAKLLYKLYEKHNTNLLLNNVRYFLGLKGSKKKNANLKMLDTLRNENQMFLAYNNGITALATDIDINSIGDVTAIEVANDNDKPCTPNDFISMGVLKKIHDFRIVNGGQTTATIFHSKNLQEKKGTKSNPVTLYGVYVQVKIIVMNNEIKNLTGKITEYSNSQSVIKYSDFSVSNEFNMKMEYLSRTMKVPSNNHDICYWFFERLRGQYDNMRSSNRTKVDMNFFDSKYPKHMKFKKEELAKVWKCWNQSPGDAVKGEATNYELFISEQVKKGFIPDEVFYKETIALLIIYKYLFNRPENKAYGNRKATVIAYSLSYLKYITFEKLDLIKIWDNQDLTNNLKVYLNTLCEEILKSLDKLAEQKEKTVLSYGKTSGAYKEICYDLPKLDRSLLNDSLIN